MASSKVIEMVGSVMEHVNNGYNCKRNAVMTINELEKETIPVPKVRVFEVDDLITSIKYNFENDRFELSVGYDSWALVYVNTIDVLGEYMKEIDSIAIKYMTKD